MATALRAPDHNARLLYDDFNEFFWDRECIDLLYDIAEKNDDAFGGKSEADQDVRLGGSTKSRMDLGTSNNAENSPVEPSARRTRHKVPHVSRENLNSVVTKLACSSKPGSGVKTFIERRTYVQVS